MKLVAKVGLVHEKNAEHMIRAFFKEFNPKSSICIKGEVAELEIFFKDVPMEIIDSITHCKVMEFAYAPHLCEDEKDEQEKKSIEPEKVEKETSTEPEPEEAVEEASVEPDMEETQEETSTTTESEVEEVQNSKNYKRGKRKKCEVPELAVFAEKSESYEDFVKTVATWLNLGKNYQFFVKLAENVMLPAKGELLWKHCQSALGEEYSKSRQNMCTTKVAAKFKGSENEVTILKLLEAIVEYRDFDFHKEVTQTTEPAEEPQDDANLVADKEVEETTIMSDILCFKEAVEKVDKTQPIEKRVKYVLTAMGVEKLKEKEQKNVLEIANVAVTEHDMDLYYILSKTNISPIDGLSARMTFTTFINNVVKNYEPNKQIKLGDFLKELQKGVMLEAEIESITN